MITIVTDSVASIPADMLTGLPVEVVTLYVNREGTEYPDATMDLDAFYADIYDMIDNIPTSSQPSQQALEEVFERLAHAGSEVLGVFISSHLSGTYEGALRAARAVKERNSGFTYALIDSTSCSMDEGWAVLAAAQAAARGEGLVGCRDAALAALCSSRFVFTPETLVFLQKGGRIGNAAALIGNLVKLFPVLTVRDGKATTHSKIRTRVRALDKTMQAFVDDVEECGLKNVVVHYIGDKAPALAWAKETVEPYLGHPVRVIPTSPVIGLHVGPAIGLAYECDRPVRDKISIPPESLVCASS